MAAGARAVVRGAEAAVQKLPGGPVRSPLCGASAAEIARLREDCAAAGLTLGDAQSAAEAESWASSHHSGVDA